MLVEFIRRGISVKENPLITLIGAIKKERRYPMAKETTKETGAILAHHMQALGGGQLEAVLSDYTEDSVLFTADGLVKGLAGIRSFFENAIKTLSPDVMQAFTMLRQDVDGEVAYILWKAAPFIPLATDTFVIQNGKIVAQTFTVLMPS